MRSVGMLDQIWNAHEALRTHCERVFSKFSTWMVFVNGIIDKISTKKRGKSANTPGFTQYPVR